MGMNRTSGVGRHTGVIPEAPGLEPWGVVTSLLLGNITVTARRLQISSGSRRPG